MELGRVDIFLEVSLMSYHLAMPRKGHLDNYFTSLHTSSGNTGLGWYLIQHTPPLTMMIFLCMIDINTVVR